jgi:hypothetical protein
MVTLAFEQLHLDGPQPTAPHDILLRAVANFSVVVDGHAVYEECEFPVVELASQLRRWLEDAAGDFEFESMSSEVKGLICFSRIAADKWRVHSRAVDTPPRDVGTDALVSACRRFIDRVRTECMARGVDIASAMRLVAKRQ